MDPRLGRWLNANAGIRVPAVIKDHEHGIDIMPGGDIQDPSGVVVVKHHLPPGLNEEETDAAMQKLVDQFFAEKIGDFILWYDTPMALSFSRHLKPALAVYDCMDELSLFKGAPTKLQDLEKELIARADLIFTGVQTLYEGKRNGQCRWPTPAPSNQPGYDQPALRA